MRGGRDRHVRQLCAHLRAVTGATTWINSARALTLLDAICCSSRTALNPAAPNLSAATLAQLFEPIRDDLRAVEGEFTRHVQSLDKITAVWFLPVVTTIVCSATGGLVAD